jgi:hypothetical protein
MAPHVKNGKHVTKVSVGLVDGLRTKLMERNAHAALLSLAAVIPLPERV